MSIPNIQQQLYLKKALNEDTDGMFDHPTLDEGSYVHSQNQLKKAVKGSKREIVKALKRGNKKDAKFWMQNKKDAESQMSESIAEGLLRRYNELTEGSRGTARHERRIASLERKRKDLFGYLDRSKGTRISAEQEREAQKRSVDPNYQAKRAKYNKLAKGLPSADYAQIARERRRAGLSPEPPTRTMKASIDRTGSPRITSSPSFKPDSDSGYVAPRVPKKVLKYRAASAAKAAKGKAK